MELELVTGTVPTRMVSWNISSWNRPKVFL